MKIALLALAICLPAHALGAPALSDFDKKMLQRADPYVRVLPRIFEEVWPDAPMRSVIPAQIEKESRWDPNAVLCVPKPGCGREKGHGFGQLTITPRFNVFEEVKPLHPLLRGWHPKDYFDPVRQMVAVVAKDRLHYRQCSKVFKGERDRMACVASSYNGGWGGVLSDVRLCSNTQGCIPTVWFEHVEKYSLKNKTPLHGYGQSFFEVNRRYARLTVIETNPKYIPYLGS
jgi:hypothetical protein